MRTETCTRLLDEPPMQVKPLPHAIMPEEAMKIILQHVHLDADGGLKNLDDNAGQHSKIEAVKKGPLEVAMALVFCFRCGLNVTKLLHFSGGMILNCLVAENHFGILTERYRHVHLPGISIGGHNAHLVIAVCAVEVVAALWVTFKMLRELCGSVCAEKEARYIRLSKCIWRDMPRLSSLSAMRAMAWVHPNLLVKHSKDFDATDRYARYLMEQFLMDQEEVLTDEEITIQAGKLIFSKDEKYASLSSEEKMDKANQFIDKGPLDVFAALRESFGSLPYAEREEKLFGFDHTVLDRHWRLRAVSFLERVVFVLVVIAMTVVGVGGLLAKLIEGSVVICSQDESAHKVVFWVVAFWNQLISVMAINELLLWRVQTFIFGGCDARVSNEEQYIIATYLGHLLRKIWESKMLTFFEKVAVTLKIDDDDLQQLIIEEDQASKSEVLASVKQHMQASGSSQGCEGRLLQWMKGPKAA